MARALVLIMLRFKVFENGAPAKSLNLAGAHLLGNDRVPLRAEIRFADGILTCETRSRGAAALAILWPVKGLGIMVLETTRLMDRTEPYNLHLELARGQLMRISQKREDWGLYDYPEGANVYKLVDGARDLLVAAMTAPDEAASAKNADAAIFAAVRAGEAVALLHADIYLPRREAASALAQNPLGCIIDPQSSDEAAIARVADAFDFVVLPLTWSQTEPQDNKPAHQGLERCIQIAKQKKIPLWGSALLSTDAHHLPAWLRAKVTTYEQLRELIARHLKVLLKAVGPQLQACEVVHGVHAHNSFRLAFEQIIELTRLATLAYKQSNPKGVAILGIAMPWGKYYADDPQTIPPVLYAEMAAQSGIPFDAISLDMRFGIDSNGLYVRDMMQVSSLIDRFGVLGKPVHIIAAGVPSTSEGATGAWHGPWSALAQAEWIKAFYRIALSKPFVETVTWHCFSDCEKASGVVCDDLSPKPAYDTIQTLRADLGKKRSKGS
jgi:hypothetical protein